MQRLTYHVSTSLDGFIAREDGSYDCFPNFPDATNEYLAALKNYGSVLMGRKTYEVGLRVGVASPYPHLKQFVFSKTLLKSPCEAVTLKRGELVETVRQLKSTTGAGIYLCGGADLARQLFDANLIDEVIVKIQPVLLGQGISLVGPMRNERALRLNSSTIHPSGVAVLRYSL
jgi:dihydrofolate reductase